MNNKSNISLEMEINLAKERKLVLFDEFTRDSVFQLQYRLDKIEQMDDKILEEGEVPAPIDVIISSFGGSVLDMLPLVGQIQRLKEKGYIIRTVTNGYSISCGFMLAICGSKGYRCINRNGYMLCHQISSQSYGTLADMEQSIDFDKKLWKKLRTIILENTNMSEELIDTIKNQKLDYWMDAEEAIELNCADVIL